MKRKALLKYLQSQGCELLREGSRHSWWHNPKYELYETGSQVRRSSKSIPSNIVEGYGRRRYQAEFVRFLIFSHSSCDETVVHLNFIKNLHEHLKEEAILLIEKYTELSKKLYKFIEYVETKWKS